MDTYAFGFPRIGRNREYKKAIEGFWKGKIGEAELQIRLTDIQNFMVEQYETYVDGYPKGEITGYDHMIDTAVMCGLYKAPDTDAYYNLCRGKDALEMTKWFNTNYHYLVPDFAGKTPEELTLVRNKFDISGAASQDRPVYLIGPFTFLKLAKGIERGDIDKFTAAVAQIYKELLASLGSVHMDEPAFVLDLDRDEISRIKRVYELLSDAGCNINVFTYYDGVSFLDELVSLPVAGIGLDFVRSPESLDFIKRGKFPADKKLYAGLVDGRNIWRTDPSQVKSALSIITRYVNEVVLTNAAPLFHVPLTTEGEELDSRLLSRLSFAIQKLEEIGHFAADDFAAVDESRADEFGENKEVGRRISGLQDHHFRRADDYSSRKNAQDASLGLPLLATTTIGSFPQTSEVRKARANYKKGRIGAKEYQAFVDGQIEDAINRQEKLGLDVLVHGEFERSDMVEFFAEKLDGIATTKSGWIISYGTRAYRPPIIFGDISRPVPMTVREVTYAQSLTDKPVKGMLTGPVTIIAWSFVRSDIPVSEVANQLGLVLRDEIADYESAGIKIIQVDEPAFREMAPNKRNRWDEYFEWAIKSFRLATAGVKPETQIHSHMCYAEFGEIIDRIHAMDFDVISIEATRSGGDVIESFEQMDFDRQIGLGVWDIHSPAVPGKDLIKNVVKRALKVIPIENFWINPDCGLKTRGWEETMASLGEMVVGAGELRRQYQS